MGTTIIVEIVRKLPDQVGCAVLPRRWLVERFFVWIGRNRRLAKDLGNTMTSQMLCNRVGGGRCYRSLPAQIR
jgi:transposase